MGIFIHHLPVPITWSLSLASLISGMLHNKFLWHWKRHWGKWEKMWCLLEMGHCRCKISVRLPKTIHCGWSWNQMWAGRIDVVIRGLWYTKESRRPLTNALVWDETSKCRGQVDSGIWKSGAQEKGLEWRYTFGNCQHIHNVYIYGTWWESITKLVYGERERAKT